MKIVVCVKQVPETSEVKIDPKTNILVREGVPSILNPFDEFSVEEGLRIREKFGGEVAVISMGPPQAEEALKNCLAMGADKAYLLTDPCLAGSDTLATSFALAQLIKWLGFDLIFCGQETTDSSTGQVGPELAEHLGIPQVTFADQVKIYKGDKQVVVRRETDKGYQIIKCSLPLLICVIKGINTPRTPQEKCPPKPVTKLSASSLKCNKNLLGVEGSPTQVIKISPIKLQEYQGFMIDPNLPAQERINLVMSGGIKKKTSSTKLEGEPDKIAQEMLKSILDILGEEHGA